MADRRVRWAQTEEEDDDELQEALSQPVSGRNEEASAAEGTERTRRLREMMLGDLGFATRDRITTRDHRENRTQVDMNLIQQGRRINQMGTAESKASAETVEILSAWSNAHTFLKDDGAADEGLQDLAAGQTHRARLMGIAHSSNEPTPQRSGRGNRGSPRRRSTSQARGGLRGRSGPQLRGSPRNRGGGGAAGGRGGGMMGSPRRASTNLRTNTERLMDAEPSNTRAIVRLPPQASRGQPSGPVLNTARDHPVEVPNVRRPARNMSFTLASPDDFMASVRNSSLFGQALNTAMASPPQPIDLLSGAAEDDPSNNQPTPMEGIEQAPIDTTRTEELFDFLEGDNTGTPTPSPSNQLGNQYGEDLEGLDMAESIVQPEEETVRAPSVDLATVAVIPEASPVKETAEEPGESEDIKGSAQRRITDYFRKAAEMALEKSPVMKAEITDSYPSAITAGDTRQETPLMRETQETAFTAEAPREEEAKNDSTQMKEAARESPPSTAQLLQSRQEFFEKSVTEGFDITQQIIGESVLSGCGRRGSSISSMPAVTAHSHTASFVSALSGTSPTLASRNLVDTSAPTVAGSRWATPNLVESSAPTISGSRWATRGRPSSTNSRDRPTFIPSLPPHLANAARPSDSGAAVRSQYQTLARPTIASDGTTTGAGPSRISAPPMHSRGLGPGHVAPGTVARRTLPADTIRPWEEIRAIIIRHTGEDPGPARVASLPLAGTRHETDSHAAATEQYNAARAQYDEDAPAPNPTHQLPALTPPTSAGHGSGLAASFPSNSFSGTIRPRPGPSMLNRGGLFSRDIEDDGPKDQPSGGRSPKRRP